ncbi:60S ribosome subunit biogenesis protein NIP7 [Nematocida sp. AWRm77]|nr:60S ribosome subunit biogenesis protein NIP7 [Nematocida sp. AWRm77]
MRSLTEEEQQKIEKKLKTYMGSNLESFLNPLYTLVLNKQKVYYVRKELLKKALVIPKESLVCLGTCLGRFTKSDYFRLKITALHALALYSTNKVKVKPSAEMSFLYGNHVQRAHLCTFAPDIKKNAGVCLLSSYGVPLGFGVMSKATSEIVSTDRTAIVVVRHGDTGEYLRGEDDLM